MPVSTGIDTLDAMLDGGLPDEHTVLMTGTPGTGKSTLAMSFLQAGIDAGEDCLYVTTEQTVEELRHSFAPFAYDIDAEALTVRSIHAAPGGGDAEFRDGSILKSYRSTPDTRSKYSLRTLGGDEGAADDLALTPGNLRQFLFHEREYDRVVIDSVSGLRTMADGDDEFRRIVLDLIQVINTDLGATGVLTAETSTVEARGGAAQLAVDDLVQYTVHGVIRLWQEEVRGNYHRYLDVMKMRGVDHDSRRFKVTFDDHGIRVVPRDDEGTLEFGVDDHLPTRIDGLDELLNGGLLVGNSVLLQHDGQAPIEKILFGVLSATVDQRLALALVPRVSTPPRFIDSMLEVLNASMEALLDRNQLFILDPLGAWYDHENVFDISSGELAAEEAVETLQERARGTGTMLSFNTEALVHTLGPDAARNFRYWVQAQALGEDDIVFDIHNPLTMADPLSAFYLDAASQVIDTWLDQTGLQWVQLRKSLTGSVGAVRLLESIEEPPYVRAVE